MNITPSIQEPQGPFIQACLGRIGSIHLQPENGQRLVCPFDELPKEMQEKEMQEQVAQILLRSHSLYQHLENHRGRYNIVYKQEGKRSFLIIAGKAIELNDKDEPLALPEDKSPPVREQKKEPDLITQARVLNEPLSIGTDLLSFVRNTISACASAALENPHSPVAVSVAGLGMMGAAGGIGGGGLIMASGIDEMLHSKEPEESDLGALKTISGAGYLGFSVSAMMMRISSLIESAAVFTQAVNVYAIDPSLFIMNLGFLLMGLYQLTIGGSFRSNFNRTVEEGGVKAGIDFLYKNLCLTEKQKESKKGAEILERKWAHFDRRTESKTAQGIAPQVEALKRKLDAGSVDEETRLEALRIFEIVSEANYKQIAKATLFILLAIAGILSVAAIGPTGSFAFFAAMAIVWFISDCTKMANWTVGNLWKLHQLLLGFILVAIEGKDDLFMNYLYSLDSKLASADERTQAQVYLEALAELDGGCYRVFQQVQSKEPKKRDHLLAMMQEIRRAAIEGDLHSAETCADHLCSAMPQFYEFLTSQLPQEEAHKTIGEVLVIIHGAHYSNIRHLSKGAQLKYAALHLLEEICCNPEASGTIPQHGHPDSALRLSRSSPV